MGQDADGMTDENCVNLDCCKLIDEKAETTPSLVTRIKNHYCTKLNYKQCARFHVYQVLGLDAIPALMLPKQTEWAEQVIEEAKLEKPQKQNAAKSG